MFVPDFTLCLADIIIIIIIQSHTKSKNKTPILIQFSTGFLCNKQITCKFSAVVLPYKRPSAYLRKNLHSENRLDSKATVENLCICKCSRQQCWLTLPYESYFQQRQAATRAATHTRALFPTAVFVCFDSWKDNIQHINIFRCHLLCQGQADACTVLCFN